MIWLSRLLTLLEIIFVLRTIRQQMKEEECSTAKEESMDVSTLETTEKSSNTH